MASSNKFGTVELKKFFYQLLYTDDLPQNLMSLVRQTRDDLIVLFKKEDFKIKFDVSKRLLYFNTALEEKIPIGIAILENYFKA